MNSLITMIHYQGSFAALDVSGVSPSFWSFEPWILVALLLAGAIYLNGWRQLNRRLSRRFTRWRLLAFVAGQLTLFLALSSPLHEWGERLLQFHMVQHLVLMMVVPPLLLLGAPTLPLLRGLPRPVLRYGLRNIFGSRMVQRLGHSLTHPLFCLFAFTLSNVAWHVPALYELALRSELWHDVQHICFLGTGLLFWWPVVQPWPSRVRWPRWTMIPYLLLADIQNTALSAFLIFSERVLYPTYAVQPRLWGISALDDQAAAGAIMWVPGSVIFLVPVAVLVIVCWTPRERARQKEKTTLTLRCTKFMIKNSRTLGFLRDFPGR